MRGIELSEHLRHHLGKVEVIVYVRQELLVCLAVAFPVNTVQVLVVELVFHLSPSVVKEILPLFVWLVVKPCLKVHVFL